MRSLRSALVIPLVVVAILGAAAGFLVTRQLAPEAAPDAARVSVITLPSTPTPEPTEKPTPDADEEEEEEEDEDGAPSSGGGGGRSRGEDRGNCPVGCTCESRAPSGVVIVCRGS